MTMNRDTHRDVAEQVRQACVEAARDGYEEARISGLCEEGAVEAAISAIQMLDLDALLYDPVSGREPD